MRIRKGTDQFGRPSTWVQTGTAWQFTLHELTDGLCSHFFRHRTEGDEPLPDALTIITLMRLVREEYEQYGTNAIWTWGEQSSSYVNEEEAREWAQSIILAVLPGLKETTP